MVIRAETGNIWQPTTSETHSWDFLSSNFAKYLLQLDWTNRNSSEMFSGLIRGATLAFVLWLPSSPSSYILAVLSTRSTRSHKLGEWICYSMEEGGYSNKEGTNTFLCVTHFQSLSKAYPKTI